MRDFEASVDGAHCFRALCSHPCCWDTERRCTRGIKRHTPARLRKHALKNEDFPSLSIVNVSEWAGRGRPIEERPLYGADTEASLNDVSCVSLSKQTKDTQKFKRANLSFPDIMLPSDKLNNTVKLNTVDISPLMGRSELPQCPVVMWIPNPHHEPQWLRRNKSKSPNITIKELVCLPSCPMTKPSIVANQWKKCNGHKRRGKKGINCTQEGAGSPRWVGIGFNPIPKTTPHHLSHSLAFKESGWGSLDQKLPSLTTPHPNPKSSSVSPALSLSLGSVKCWRDH
ncbi:uncharacterized protein C9orf43 homolog isoform X2 [Onychostoma macrolepis]|uniref:Uncharacterized protein n=2 Tax=Onychostoma macrolepis TaxID=369639 RepID=A0A7J6CVF2_9TELE|nr:uncharacterized protein C9orf43 homolog isoform X2 [Onychostoma macrolepis]KAF4109682.1 hypothetical protein G5714_008934 [Onychostoma macrolepis]